MYIGAESLEVRQGPLYRPDAGWSVSAIVADVDNTLVGDNSREAPTEKAIEQIKRAAMSRVHFSVMSARGVSKLDETIIQPLLASVPEEHHEMLRYHVASNGGQIYDALERKMVYQAIILPGTATDIAHRLQSFGVDHWVQDDGVDHFWGGQVAETGLGMYTKQFNLWLPPADDNREDVIDYAPQTPLVIVAEGLDDKQYSELETLVNREYVQQGIAFRPYDYVETSAGKRHKVFILPEQASKRTALSKLSERTGVALQDTMTIGDGTNDEELLRASVKAGGVGVAMGNAKQNVIKVATHIAPSQREDGAAIAIKHMLDHHAPFK